MISSPTLALWEGVFAVQRAYWDAMLPTSPKPKSTQLTVVENHNHVEEPDAAERVIDIGEEVLEVSKRKVVGSAVKVRRITREVPVERRIELIDEVVVIERFPGDGVPVNEEALSDREYILADVREIAVVAKHAQSKGRVVLKRKRTGRIETLHETVRHTEVKIDQPHRMITEHQKTA